MFLRRLRLAALAALCAFAALPRAHTQDIATARRAYSLDVFAGATAGDPKFGPTTRELGYTVGGDLTRRFSFLDVSFEPRYASITGYSADEKTFGGGVKVSRQYHRFHPYVDFLVASGTIHFDHPEIYTTDSSYTHDSSLVYIYGGGVDIDATRNFALKVDFQGSRWNIGTERVPFNPYNGSVGIVYTIPFRALSH